MTNKNLNIQDQTSEFLLYTAPNGDVKVEVLLSGETIWLTQKRIAELFAVGVPAISKHLDNIYESGELQREATLSILETVQQEGKREVKRKLEYYNLDAVISVGYRVNSTQATQFRIWATALIKDYIIKGFVMDDERLKNGRFFGKDYFKELLERVRSIRASERRIYQQITDIFAESVNKLLAFNEYQVLEGFGNVTRRAAEQKAHAAYEQFNKQQKIESDFDREVKKLLGQGSKKKDVD